MNAWVRFIGALAILHLALVLPDWPGNLVSYSFLRLPVELPLMIVVMLAVPARAQWHARWVLTLVLSTVVVLKVANLVTFELFARPFNILVDPGLTFTALMTISAGQGVAIAMGAIALSVFVVAAIFVMLWWSISQIGTSISPLSLRTSMASAAMALLLAVPLSNVKFRESWWYIAGWDSSKFAYARATSIIEGLEYDAAFREELAALEFQDVSNDVLLKDLRGVDVILVFVEAYGRAAIEEPSIAPSIRASLEQFETTLQAQGFAARSTWMTSPTFGGQSWLAHSTFATGLWVDNQRRYESLFVSERETLFHDFSRAGWRTVGVMPQIIYGWLEGQFYGYDKIYAAADLEYNGPRFDYMTMPDQFTLWALHKRELTDDNRSPIVAEVGLISSHLPWTPLPKVVPWTEIKNGEVFFEARHPRAAIDWTDSEIMRANYTAAIHYELETLESFVANLVKRRTLLIIVGDHQPIPVVSGDGAPHHVPVHLISNDVALIEAVEHWDWTPGMIPGAFSPVWRMDAMRTRLLDSFTPSVSTSSLPVAP